MIRPKVWLGLFNLFKLKRYFPKLNFSRRLRERIWNLPKSPEQWHSLVLNIFCHGDFVFKRSSSMIFFVCAKSNKSLHLQGLRSHFWFPPPPVWCEILGLLNSLLYFPRTRSIYIPSWITTGAGAHEAYCFLYAGVAYVNACSGKRRHLSHPDGNSVSLTHPLDTLKLQLW